MSEFKVESAKFKVQSSKSVEAIFGFSVPKLAEVRLAATMRGEPQAHRWKTLDRPKGSAFPQIEAAEPRKKGLIFERET